LVYFVRPQWVLHLWFFFRDSVIPFVVVCRFFRRPSSAHFSVINQHIARTSLGGTVDRTDRHYPVDTSVD
jgi:hypothetical protein